MSSLMWLAVGISFFGSAAAVFVAFGDRNRTQPCQCSIRINDEDPVIVHVPMSLAVALQEKLLRRAITRIDIPETQTGSVPT